MHILISGSLHYHVVHSPRFFCCSLYVLEPSAHTSVSHVVASPTSKTSIMISIHYNTITESCVPFTKHLCSNTAFAGTLFTSICQVAALFIVVEKLWAYSRYCKTIREQFSNVSPCYNWLHILIYIYSRYHKNY